MDIVREKPKNKIGIKIFAVFALVIVLFLAFKLVFNRDSSTYAVNSHSLLTDKVEQGELYVSVRGIGKLVPKDIRWVATNVEGRVDRILIKAGAQVKAGDLLMELSNPRLVQHLEETRWELDEMEAETTALEVSLESDLLDQEAAVINEKLNHERALLTLNAQKKLLEQGVVAVSHILHEETKIDVAQFKQRWELEIKRLAKRRENLAAQRLAAQARVNRMHKILQRAQEQVDNLNVKASMDSIVQKMPMELGQQVSSGTNLARLARRGEFIAELRIPEKLINEVLIGQVVTVDTRTSKISGKVKRIDPAVVNGSVQVDVELTGDIPKEARPDLTIEGEIDIARINNTLFVQRPMFAEYVHQCSARNTCPFIAVNMGAISENLFESEMFGHIKGAYTDAKDNRIGRFELAEGGTLFLDEIANIPSLQQAKLLHVLEAHQFEKVGSSKTQRVDVRMVSATNSNLSELIEQGQFRQDLLYRLNTVEIIIPPLRERIADIKPLAVHFLAQHAEKYRLPQGEFTKQALEALQAYSWPGNIRELNHMIERAIFLRQGQVITAADLGLNNTSKDQLPNPKLENIDISHASLDVIEKIIIEQRLEQFNYNGQETATSLGLSRSAYYRRLEKHNLPL